MIEAMWVWAVEGERRRACCEQAQIAHTACLDLSSLISTVQLISSVPVDSARLIVVVVVQQRQQEAAGVCACLYSEQTCHYWVSYGEAAGVSHLKTAASVIAEQAAVGAAAVVVASNSIRGRKQTAEERRRAAHYGMWQVEQIQGL